MPQPPPQDAALPSRWNYRQLNFTDVRRFTDAPLDTVYGWHRLIRAAGHDFGKKQRGEWTFNSHELYTFGLITAMYDLGHPIGLTPILQVLDFAKEPGRPEAMMFIAGKTAYGTIVIDAPTMFEATRRVVARAMGADDV